MSHSIEDQSLDLTEAAMVQKGLDVNLPKYLNNYVLFGSSVVGKVSVKVG